MPPTPLLTKGSGTLARKWKKIKKRCSSFSSGDGISRSSTGQERADDPGDDDVFVKSTTQSISISNVSAYIKIIQKLI